MKDFNSFHSLLPGGLLCLLLAGACVPAPRDYASWVDPFIGTGGHGHTYPGAVVPNGMIQPSPDTRIDGWDACSGYYYADSTLNGFSHTHVSGTGCADYGDVLLMPTVGPQDVRPVSRESQQLSWASPFSHDREVAEPGYYAVFLDRYGVQAELTSTARAAIHRYTFPEAQDAGFILDLDYSIQHQTNEEMQLEVVSDTEIRGRKKTVYWAFDQYINFYAKFSKPFACTLLTDSVTPPGGTAPGATWSPRYPAGILTACAARPGMPGTTGCPASTSRPLWTVCAPSSTLPSTTPGCNPTFSPMPTGATSAWTCSPTRATWQTPSIPSSPCGTRSAPSIR